MAADSHEPLRKTKFEILLDPSEVETLHKYRGDLSPEAFIAVLIRILESGAVSDIPDWVRKARPTKTNSNAS